MTARSRCSMMKCLLGAFCFRPPTVNPVRSGSLRMNRVSRLFLAAASAVLALGAQTAPHLSPAATRMKREVAMLAAPRMEGRGNGSKGLALAADYVERYY